MQSCLQPPQGNGEANSAKHMVEELDSCIKTRGGLNKNKQQTMTTFVQKTEKKQKLTLENQIMFDFFLP